MKSNKPANPNAMMEQHIAKLQGATPITVTTTAPVTDADAQTPQTEEAPIDDRPKEERKEGEDDSLYSVSSFSI